MLSLDAASANEDGSDGDAVDDASDDRSIVRTKPVGVGMKVKEHAPGHAGRGSRCPKMPTGTVSGPCICTSGAIWRLLPRP